MDTRYAASLMSPCSPAWSGSGSRLISSPARAGWLAEEIVAVALGDRAVSLLKKHCEALRLRDEEVALAARAVNEGLFGLFDDPDVLALASPIRHRA